MEYLAMFVWLLIGLILGGLIHVVLRNAFEYKIVTWLAAPGLAVRKSSMTAAALVSGATVTDVNIYQLSERDIGFTASGIASVAKFLVPVAPLFACAFVLQVINSALGGPLDLVFSPPAIASFDTGGAKGFMAAFWAFMCELVQRVYSADWQNTNLYVLSGLIFSLSLGAGVAFAEFRESLMGVAIMVLGLVVVCGLFGVPSSDRPGAGFVTSAREFLMATAGMSLIMMLCGMAVAITVGLVVRLVQLVTHASASGSSKGKTPTSAEDREDKPEKRRAA